VPGKHRLAWRGAATSHDSDAPSASRYMGRGDSRLKVPARPANGLVRPKLAAPVGFGPSINKSWTPTNYLAHERSGSPTPTDVRTWASSTSDTKLLAGEEQSVVGRSRSRVRRSFPRLDGVDAAQLTPEITVIGRLHEAVAPWGLG